jgi:archaetidylinositol phosphate synthase
MLSKLKEKVQSLLSAEARVAHKMGLSPNVVSVIGLIFSIFSAAAYLVSFNQTWLLFIAAALLLISGFCDVLDGVLARTYDQETNFGGFFDSLLDRYSESVVYIGIIVGGLCEPFWGILALIGSLLVSYSRARAEAIGIKMMSIGLMERAERLILLIASSIVAYFWFPALNIGIIVLAILSNFTVLERVFYVYRAIKKISSKS